jgi:hypothetical protein
MVKPMYVGFGTTRDISALLLFYFYQRILYLDPGNSFPDSKEKCGCFVGIAETVGKVPIFIPSNIIGLTYLSEREVDGSVHRAKIV